MAYSWIPDIVKHCTVAIFREGGVTGKNQKDKFTQCFEIAKARLAQYGFLALGGRGPTDPIGLTTKGRVREQHHKREGRAKSVLFDTLYELHDLDGSRAAREKKASDLAAKQETTLHGEPDTTAGVKPGLFDPDQQAGGVPRPRGRPKPVPKRKRL